MTPRKINLFTLLKLPSAWLTGVRVKTIDRTRCEVTVKHRWINQNPFNSMYFAVQAMAAELSTGALVMSAIRSSGKDISMLVARNEATFSKKAKGRILFVCTDGEAINQTIQQTIDTGEPQTLWMTSTGVNADGAEVSTFRFEWTVRVRQSS